MAEPVHSRQSRCIVWRVKNIFCVDSLETEPFSFNNSRWRLLLLKLGSGGKEKIVIYLHKVDSNETLSNEIRSYVFIEDKKRMLYFPKRRNEWRSNVCVWWRFTRKLREKEETLLTDGIVTFVCLFMADGKPEDETQREALVNVETGIDLEHFSHDSHHLFDMDALPDVMLKCGHHLIRAHKSILSSRSQVFLDLFRSDTIRSRCEIVEIPDTEPVILNQLVQYIYSGKVSDLSLDSAQKLYATADAHAIDSLKRLCGNFLKENLTEENACSFLVFAEAQGDKDIKDYVLSFIMETELLRDDDHWLKFLQEHAELAADVLHMVYKAQCHSRRDVKYCESASVYKFNASPCSMNTSGH